MCRDLGLESDALAARLNRDFTGIGGVERSGEPHRERQKSIASVACRRAEVLLLVAMRTVIPLVRRPLVALGYGLIYELGGRLEIARAVFLHDEFFVETYALAYPGKGPPESTTALSSAIARSWAP